MESSVVEVLILNGLEDIWFYEVVTWAELKIFEEF
jgi:hypothetical protein